MNKMTLFVALSSLICVTNSNATDQSSAEGFVHVSSVSGVLAAQPLLYDIDVLQLAELAKLHESRKQANQMPTTNDEDSSKNVYLDSQSRLSRD